MPADGLAHKVCGRVVDPRHQERQHQPARTHSEPERWREIADHDKVTDQPPQPEGGAADGDESGAGMRPPVDDSQDHRYKSQAEENGDQ